MRLSFVAGEQQRRAKKKEAMASFLNKAFAALEPLQREALGALDKSLGEEGLENADDYAEHAKSAEETGEKWAQVGLDKLKPEW